MKSLKWVVVYGVLLWLIPFAISFAIFPLRNSERALFESVMAVTVTVCCVIFANLYFRQVTADFLREGALVGFLWLAISIVFDSPIFFGGPIQMSPLDYLKDIGVTYLIYPVITLGFSWRLAQGKERWRQI